MRKIVFFALFIFTVVLAIPAQAKPKQAVFRVGHFPNVTHAQAVIAQAQHKLEEAVGDEAKVEWKIFNAGPSAVEALFSGNLDIAVLGPSPAVNAYVKSGGEAVRVISGAASGGAALVVRADLNIEKAEDFKGKKIASPQLGNTQDVSLRAWLAQSGLKLKEKGGDVQVLPVANADQLTLLAKKDLDASWTVEPWVSILVEKTGAKVFLEESELWADGKYSTALVLVRKKFLDEQPALVRKFLEVHVDITDWIAANPAEAKKAVKAEIEKESGKELPESILESSFKRIEFSVEPVASSIVEQAKSAYTAGFLKDQPDLAALFDLSILEEVLKARGQEPEWLADVPRLAPPAAEAAEQPSLEATVQT